MAEVVGIRFKEVGKVYYFDPDGKTFEKGDRAIVETARGVECGEVTMGKAAQIGYKSRYKGRPRKSQGKRRKREEGIFRLRRKNT